MRDCAAVRERLSPYLDGDLGVAARVEVDTHLEQCPPCRATVQRATLSRDLLRQAPRLHVSDDFDGRLRERLTRELQHRPWWRVPVMPRLDSVTSRPVVGAAVGLAVLATVVAYSGRQKDSATDTTFRAPRMSAQQVLPGTGAAVMAPRSGDVVIVGQTDSLSRQSRTSPPRRAGAPEGMQHVRQTNP